MIDEPSDDSPAPERLPQQPEAEAPDEDSLGLAAVEPEHTPEVGDPAEPAVLDPELVESEPAGDQALDDQVAAAPSWTRHDVSDPDEREAALTAAVTAIRAGECIVLPTDTVYGIGAKAQDAAAVTKLLAAKKRGRDMPPPVLIADAAMAGALVEDLPEYAEALAIQFWPGPLTLILQAQAGLGMDLGDTDGTIAVRVPDHEFTRSLLRRTGPLAVSSANVSGHPASTTIDEAIEQLGNDVRVYLDAGPTPGHEPSSIVDFTVSTAGELVRMGALDEDQLKAWAPLLVWEPPATDAAADEVDEAPETIGLPTEDSAAEDAVVPTETEDPVEANGDEGTVRTDAGA